MLLPFLGVSSLMTGRAFLARLFFHQNSGQP
jgi:hypothetical protein